MSKAVVHCNNKALDKPSNSSPLIVWNDLLSITNTVNHAKTIVFSPSGKYVAFLVGRHIEVFDTQTKEGTVFSDHPLRDHLCTVCFSQNEKFLAAQSPAEIVLWNMEDPNNEFTGFKRNANMTSKPSWIGFRGRFLTGIGANGFLASRVVVWFEKDNLADGEKNAAKTFAEKLRGLKHSKESVVSMLLCPEERFVALTGERKIWLHDLQSTKLLWGKTSPVRDISFSPSGETLAALTIEGQIELLDTKTGLMIGEKTLKDVFGILSAVEWSPDGRSWAFVDSEGNATLQSFDVNRQAIIPLIEAKFPPYMALEVLNNLCALEFGTKMEFESGFKTKEKLNFVVKTNQKVQRILQKSAS